MNCLNCTFPLIKTDPLPLCSTCDFRKRRRQAYEELYGPLPAGGVKPPPQPAALDQQVAGNHYKGMAIQPAEYCQKNKLSYCESSVIRYVSRHREKNGREDIEKAIHCLQLLLEMEYPTPNTEMRDRHLEQPTPKKENDL